MIRVGVVGLGMMGLTHLDVYRKHPLAQLVAICDSDSNRLHGKTQAAGNIEGQARTSVAELDIERHQDFAALLHHPQIDLIDICLPTDMHVSFGSQVLQAGKHLLIEKPLARNAEEAAPLLVAEAKAKGLALVGHCMRFWPGWTWLKEAIDEQRYGRVFAATFRRVCSHPAGPFYADGDRCGGAALDLHIHDTDFVQFCFGMPKAVTSFGYSKLTNRPDHLVTRYHFDDVPLVVAEGSWCMADGFAFSMAFTVNFEHATAVFDSAKANPLTLSRDGQTEVIAIDSAMGYDLEIDYFLKCLESGTRPQVVTLLDALNSVRIVDAEVESIRTGERVAVRSQPPLPA